MLVCRVMSHFDQVLSLAGVVFEFFPISSSAHMWLAGDLVGVTTDSRDLIAAHLVPLLVLSLYFVPTKFWFLRDIFASKKQKSLVGFVRVECAAMMSVVPLVVIVVAQKFLGWTLSDVLSVWSKGRIIGMGFVLGGGLLLCADLFGSARKRVQEISLWDGFLVGVVQCFALIPGVSRLGLSLTATRFLGYNQKDSVFFGFLTNAYVLCAVQVLHWRDCLEVVQSLDLWSGMMLLCAGGFALWFALWFLRGKGILLCAGYRIVLGIMLLWVY